EIAVVEVEVAHERRVVEGRPIRWSVAATDQRARAGAIEFFHLSAHQPHWLSVDGANRASQGVEHADFELLARRLRQIIVGRSDRKLSQPLGDRHGTEVRYHLTSDRLVSTCAWRWREQQRRRRGRRADSESDPHPRGAVSGYATEDQVLPCRLRGEAQDVLRLRRKPFLELQREGPRNGGMDGLLRQRRARSDDFGAMGQHPVVVAEVDLRLPPYRYFERERPVTEPVEVQGAVQPGEPSDQLEADRFGGCIETQPGWIHHPLLLSTRGNGERKGNQPHYRRE